MGSWPEPEEDKILKSCQNETGQMSVFFAMSFLILISCMAFIVNVGMFVKARINLQNAVDAAAFAGAAVQARQLSNIAYLNWEMRNVYKEWMFKYYVLGQIANPKTDPNDPRGRYAASGKKMDFRASRFNTNATADETGDLFNVPSTCIHFAGSDVNICAIYSLPGLPRFSPLGLVGIDDTHNEFMNAIVKEKSNDCTKRADMNFKTGINFVYGTISHALEGTPEIAASRPGSWPKAFELAARVRNQEKLVNEPPMANLCAAGTGCTNINQLPIPQSGGQLPLNERKIKAFWSAFRNLENNDAEVNGTPNLKQTFKLTELSPTKKSSSSQTMDGVLIPNNMGDKYYLDLHLVLLNLVNFYTLFSPYTGNSAATDPNAPPSEAACDSIKSGLPIPSYPFGYIKNPEFITYYAVKGEAEYTGLFNPFQGPSKLTAYAAAKPFGGRIGPALFLIKKGATAQIQARSANNRSFPYISGLDAQVIQDFKRGYPIPLKADFWVNVNSAGSVAIGGHPSVGVVYGVPNMIYDLVGMGDQSGGGSQLVQNITPTKDWVQIEPIEQSGLNQKDQYEYFKSNLQNTGGALNALIIDQALDRVRSPTKYEALNYLIPTQDPDGTVASAPAIVPPPGPGNGNSVGTPYMLFGPLWGEGSLYLSRQAFQAVFEDFVALNMVSIEKYIGALQSVAKSIFTSSQNLGNNPDLGSSTSNYVEAAKNIHDNPTGSLRAVTCVSMAGKFGGFFLGPKYGYPQCKDKAGMDISLTKNILDFWEDQVNANPSFRTHFIGTYVNPFKRDNSGDLQNLQMEPERGKRMMTAYLPGEIYGATKEGVFSHPFADVASNITGTFKMDRNYYSTKFVALQVLGGPFVEGSGGGGKFTIYSEGMNVPPADIQIESFANRLDPMGITGGLSSVEE